MQQPSRYPGKYYRFSEFRKYDVVDSRGDSLGTIEDCAFDFTTGQIHHFFVKAGDFLGLGGKMIAIPYRAVDFRDDKVYLHRTKDELMKAPWTERDQMFGPDYERTWTGYWGDEWSTPRR
ncbi:MAG: PRC-barrel domain-containing protein [Chloroflexi bacterium]|nr:PRC-barrel domain-containing protein [Chloroflexota bacterium]